MRRRSCSPLGWKRTLRGPGDAEEHRSDSSAPPNFIRGLAHVLALRDLRIALAPPPEEVVQEVNFLSDGLPDTRRRHV